MWYTGAQSGWHHRPPDCQRRVRGAGFTSGGAVAIASRPRRGLAHSSVIVRVRDTTAVIQSHAQRDPAGLVAAAVMDRLSKSMRQFVELIAGICMRSVIPATKAGRHHVISVMEPSVSSTRC
jgi:hypothetical protein